MSDPEWLTDEVFYVDELLSATECARLLESSEEWGYEEALVTSPQGHVRREDVRNNYRVIVDDPDLAADLWEKVEELVPVALEEWRATGVNERFRFYRYDPGQQFDWHQDFPFERDNGEQSLFTLMVYLNDGFEGGETAFDDSCSDEPFEAFEVTPAQGMGLFFRHHLWHKGEPVLRGRKYVLRTDVMYSPRRRIRRQKRRP